MPGACCTVLPRSLFVLVLVIWMAPAAQATQCQRQTLVRAMPHQLGVAHVELMGQLLNAFKGERETVVMHMFIKIVRHPTRTYLRGYGWVEHANEFVGEYGPHHKDFLHNPLPAMYVRYLYSASWSSDTPITVTRGKDRNLGFRLDAAINTTNATLFQIKVHGWLRTIQLALDDFRAWPGVLTPFYNMAVGNTSVQYDPITGLNTPSRRRLRALPSATGLPPPWQSPLVAVVFLGFAPLSPAHLVFKAQHLLRHVEYHILQARMQRVLVYVREAVWAQQVLRDYIAMHMPADVQPYVTFVVWNEVPIVDIEHRRYWDQLMVYYHAAVAVIGNPSTMVAFIDLDEYIAWPKPATSLHAALERCSYFTANLVSIGLTSMYALCGDCDYENNPYVEQAWWASVTRKESDINATDVSSSCRWYNQDPLVRYNWTWDDTWMTVNNMTWAKHRTSNTIWHNRGKQLLRTVAAKAFCHHGPEGLGTKQRWLDPEKCPFIAHLPNLHIYRGNHTRGGLPWFAKRWTSKWWLIEDSRRSRGPHALATAAQRQSLSVQL